MELRSKLDMANSNQQEGRFGDWTYNIKISLSIQTYRIWVYELL